MKPPFILFCASVALSLPATAQDNSIKEQRPVLTVLSFGQPQTLDETSQQEVRFWLQQLMLSCLMSNVVQESSPEEWGRRLAWPKHLHCRYGRTATLAIPERDRILEFDEVLLPLTESYPDYIFVKRGPQVLRLAKYDPWVLHQLVSAIGLPLYQDLTKVERHHF
jgi:hypothetical protein